MRGWCGAETASLSSVSRRGTHNYTHRIDRWQLRNVHTCSHTEGQTDDNSRCHTRSHAQKDRHIAAQEWAHTFTHTGGTDGSSGMCTHIYTHRTDRWHLKKPTSLSSSSSKADSSRINDHGGEWKEWKCSLGTHRWAPAFKIMWVHPKAEKVNTFQLINVNVTWQCTLWKQKANTTSENFFFSFFNHLNYVSEANLST